MEDLEKILKKNAWIILILTIAFLIRIPLLPHCLWVDEARDLSITYNLIHNGTLTTFSGAWYFQHPIMQYLILSFSVALNSELLATLTIAILSLISVYATYIIGKKLFNEKVGLLSAFILSMQPIFLFYSARILNDMTHITFIILSFMFLVLYEKDKKDVYAGLSVAFSLFAVTTRITSFFLPILIIGYLLFENKKLIKNKWLYYGFLIGIIPGLAWIGLNYVHTGHIISLQVWENHLKPNIIDAGPWFYYLANFVNIYSLSLTVLFIISLIVHSLLKFKKIKLLLIWFILYFIVISWVAVKVPRYTLPTMAPLVIISVSGFYLISKIKGAPKQLEPILIIIIIAIGIWLGYNGYVMTKFKAQTFCGLKEISNYIGNHKTFAGSATELSWYTKRNIDGLPRNITEFSKEVKCGDYLEVDLWERTQPKYIFYLLQTNQSNFKVVSAWPLLSKDKFVYLLQYECV